MATFSTGSDEIHELFEAKQALLEVAQEFFDRSNQCPEKILSMIGSKAKKVSWMYLVSEESIHWIDNRKVK